MKLRLLIINGLTKQLFSLNDSLASGFNHELQELQLKEGDQVLFVMIKRENDIIVIDIASAPQFSTLKKLLKERRFYNRWRSLITGG